MSNKTKAQFVVSEGFDQDGWQSEGRDEHLDGYCRCENTVLFESLGSRFFCFDDGSVVAIHESSWSVHTVVKTRVAKADSLSYPTKPRNLAWVLAVSLDDGTEFLSWHYTKKSAMFFAKTVRS